MKTEVNMVDIILDFSENEQDVMKQAIAHFGAGAQFVKAGEELAELNAEISKNAFQRLSPLKSQVQKSNKTELAGELADALIMLWQVMYIEDISCEVSDLIEIKLQRLDRLLRAEAAVKDDGSNSE